MNELIKEICDDSAKSYKKMAEFKVSGDMDNYKIYKDCLEAYAHYTRGETPMPQDMKGAQLSAWNGIKEYLFPAKKVVLEEIVSISKEEHAEEDGKGTKKGSKEKGLKGKKS